MAAAFSKKGKAGALDKYLWFRLPGTGRARAGRFDDDDPDADPTDGDGSDEGDE